MNSKFDLEILEQKENQMMNDEEGSVTQKDKMEIKSQISQRLSLISNRQYGWNIVILTIFWTVSSFSFYLL